MPSSSSSCQSVAGVWSRLFEEDPIGDDANADKTTLVLWTQTPTSGIYVDLRLPLHSPGRLDTDHNTIERTLFPSALRAIGGGDARASLEQYDVSLLTRQKSFAGVLTCTSGDTSDPPGRALANDPILAKLAKEGEEVALPLCTCFWRRDIDFQPPSGGLDIGVCASYSPLNTKDGTVDMRETGDDGSYAEGWHRLENTFQGPFLAMELVSETTNEQHAQARTGYWVRTGNRFAYAIGRPTSVEMAQALGCSTRTATVKDQVGKKLEQVVMVDCAESPEDKWAVLATYIAVTGQISDEAEWCIENSTHPGLVGCRLVGTDGSNTENCCSVLKSSTNNEDAKEGDLIEQVICGQGNFVRKWKVVELNGCALPF